MPIVENHTTCATAIAQQLQQLEALLTPFLLLHARRYGVAIGAWFAPVVKVLMYVCSPITWPLSKLLDWVLGHEDSAMQRRELKAMVQLHTAEAGNARETECSTYTSSSTSSRARSAVP